MRYQKYRKHEHRYNRLGSLLEWFKKSFTITGAKKHNKKINNELSGLSEHLLDDLGFNKKGQPLHWTSFLPEKTKFTCLKLPGKKTEASLQNQRILRKNCCP